MRAETNPYRGLENVGAFLVPPEPDVLRVVRGEQHLYFMRTDHTHYPLSRHIGTILGGFRMYLSETRREDQEIYCEGRVLPYSQDLKAAIKLYGERGLVSWLSQECNIPIFSANPEGDSEFKTVLEQGYDPDAIMYYLNLRHRVQYDRSEDERSKTPDPKRHAQKVLHFYADKFKAFDPNGWQYFSLQAAHAKFFGNTEMADFNQYFFDPFFAADQTVNFWQTDNEVQAVATAWSIQRMQYHLQTLDERLKLGKSPFVIHGWQHGHAWEEKIGSLGTSWSVDEPYTGLETFLGEADAGHSDYGHSYLPDMWLEPGYLENPAVTFTYLKLLDQPERLTRQ